MWARLVDSPMQSSIGNEITKTADDVKRTAETCRNAITTLTGRIAHALNYRPGQPAPSYNAGDFDTPGKVVVDMGTYRYGYAGNTPRSSQRST